MKLSEFISDLIKENKNISFLFLSQLLVIIAVIFSSKIDNYYTRIDLDKFKNDYYWFSFFITFSIGLYIIYKFKYSNKNILLESFIIKDYFFNLFLLLLFTYFTSKSITLTLLKSLNLIYTTENIENKYIVSFDSQGKWSYKFINKNKFIYENDLSDETKIEVIELLKFKQGDTITSSIRKGLLGINYLEK